MSSILHTLIPDKMSLKFKYFIQNLHKEFSILRLMGNSSVIFWWLKVNSFWHDDVSQYGLYCKLITDYTIVILDIENSLHLIIYHTLSEVNIDIPNNFVSFTPSPCLYAALRLNGKDITLQPEVNKFICKWFVMLQEMWNPVSLCKCMYETH